MASRQKTKEVFIELINLQLEPHGKTYKDVVKESDWYMKYSTTREKEQSFITEATKILRTKLRMSKTIAEKEINWFILQWGLTTTSDEYKSEEMLVKTKTKLSNNKNSKSK